MTVTTATGLTVGVRHSYLRAAHQIRPYVSPQWFVVPFGDVLVDTDESQRDDLNEIAGQGYEILGSPHGWFIGAGDEYYATAIIHVYATDADEPDGAYYLAKIG